MIILAPTVVCMLELVVVTATQEYVSYAHI